MTLFNGGESREVAIVINGARDSVIRKNRIRADQGNSHHIEKQRLRGERSDFGE